LVYCQSNQHLYVITVFVHHLTKVSPVSGDLG
jgi:hypothetical protein